jgi:putative sterol carrier protein
MFDPGAAEGFEASYELRMGEDRFRAEVSGGTFEVERGSVERPDAIIQADPATLVGLVYEDLPLAEALRSGDVKIEGDEAAVERFLTLFPLPEVAALVQQ